MPIPRQEFVKQVWNVLGAGGPTDFARKLGLGPDGLQKVRRRQGGGRLDYEDVMVMLERTGWFVMGDSGVQASDPPNHPGELEGVLREMVQAQQRALRRQTAMAKSLRALQEMLDARLPARPDQREEGTA